MGGFTCNRVGTTGCEIRDPDGIVVAWATDETWALVIAGLLNRIETEGLSSLGSQATSTGASLTQPCRCRTDTPPGLRPVAADEPIRGRSG
jgi:hypothetical protein